MTLLFIAWNWQAENNEWDKVEECCRNNGETHADFATRKATQMKEHNALVDAYMVNLNKSCMMACDGIIHVLGSAAKKKHKKNIGDCWVSITVVCVGLAAGNEGGRIYLAKGKTLEQNTFKKFGRGEQDHHPAPGGTFVEMTPNTYMTDESWCKIAQNSAKGYVK